MSSLNTEHYEDTIVCLKGISTFPATQQHESNWIPRLSSGRGCVAWGGFKTSTSTCACMDAAVLMPQAAARFPTLSNGEQKNVSECFGDASLGRFCPSSASCHSGSCEHNHYSEQGDSV